MRFRTRAATVLAAFGFVLAFALPGHAEDPTPSVTDTPSPSQSPSATPEPEPTTPTQSTSPTKTPRPTDDPSQGPPQLDPSPGGSAPPSGGGGDGKGHHQNPQRGSGRTTSSGPDRFLVDVALDTLKQATQKARAALAAAGRARKAAERAEQASRQANRELAVAEVLAAEARGALGDVAGTMYAYNLNPAALADPEAALWQFGLEDVPPEMYADLSAQLSHLADNAMTRIERAEAGLAVAEVARAAAGSAEAEAEAVLDKALASEERALATARDARQVFLRVSQDEGGSSTEAWWAHESADGDLGRWLAGLKGGPQISLAFHYPGSRIVTSTYGMRVHPITHERKLHTGVDYAPGTGKFVAARGGKVVRAAYDVAYGNYVVILHGQMAGRSVATLYAHAAALYVREGDRVRTGDILGLVGSTGYSTGAHLHFEVRVDGQPVDPVPLVS